MMRKCWGNTYYQRFTVCLLTVIAAVALSNVGATPIVSSDPSLLGIVKTCRGGSATDGSSRDAVLEDIAESMSSNSNEDLQSGVLGFHSNVAKAARDFSVGEDDESGSMAFKFLRGLASSSRFVEDYWHKQPLLIRAKDTGGWVEGAFTVDRDLRLVGNSYITGHRTGDVLRNGTKTDTWAFRQLKDDPTKKTTWEEVEEALKGGTIYFNTAGSLWPRLGGLCRLTNAAFGIPSNVNVYITPPGTTISVPPHTDRQDVLVFQTAGAKRWRVFPPPPRRKGPDPLNRGKVGDVLSFEEMGEPLIDTVVQSGDVLYVPTGFPHTTDTCTVVDMEEATNNEATVFEETSVHMTMGVDTHVWALTFAHIRWAVLQRCEKNFNLQITDDEAYWDAMDTIPIGFLGLSIGWKQCLDNIHEGNGLTESFRESVIEETKRVMIRLEPSRWRVPGMEESMDQELEQLPPDEGFGEVVDYMILDHLLPLMEVQEEMFSENDPHSEESLVKSFHCIQKQNRIMEKFGVFCKNEAMRQMFEQKRMEGEEKAKYL